MKIYYKRSILRMRKIYSLTISRGIANLPIFNIIYFVCEGEGNMHLKNIRFEKSSCSL